LVQNRRNPKQRVADIGTDVFAQASVRRSLQIEVSGCGVAKSVRWST
jgi:hypothetical protein